MKQRRKKKLVKVLNKALTGAKGFYREGKKVVREYGPGVVRFSKRASTNIQRGFAVKRMPEDEDYLDLTQKAPARVRRPENNGLKPDFSVRPQGRFPSMVDKRRIRRRVDWDNLGVNI
jgi:hypothetical protein